MGVIFQAASEKTLYLAGDTIYYDEVETVLQKYRPDVIIVNDCAANSIGYGRLITERDDNIKVHEQCPNAVIIVSHMGCISHA